MFYILLILIINTIAIILLRNKTDVLDARVDRLEAQQLLTLKIIDQLQKVKDEEDEE